MSASPDTSTRELLRSWTELQTRTSSLRDPDAVAQVKLLARGLVARRSSLFARNALLQADAAPGDDAALDATLAALQDEIKSCTTALTEMNDALGRTSLPA